MESTKLTSGTYAPGPSPNTVRAGDGSILTVPEGWILLPPGDAALTRRVKTGGKYWLVQEKKGRKLFSRGIWAPAETVEAVFQELERERAKPSFAKTQEQRARRRARDQDQYVNDFVEAVARFLDFHPMYADLGRRLAQAVSVHATPVGSGTVARTQRIPIEDRAEAAVIAWLRHNTTEYDEMTIPRVRGKRREVRRMLAKRSEQLLNRYRRGEMIEDCALEKTLTQTC